MEALDTGMRTFSRIFSLSFSGKKIALQIGGMVCACVASLIILHIGVFIFRERLQTLIALVNWVAVIFIMFVTWGAIAKVTVAEVAGLPAVDIKGALRAARKSAKPLIIAPLKIVLIIFVMMLCHVVADWCGLIPVIGEIVWPFLAIPLFFLSALILAAELIFVCGTFLLPSIIMVGKESPVSELNDFLRSHTLRFIGYLVATAVVVGIALLFFHVLMFENEMLSQRAMGDKYANIVSSVPPKMYAAFNRVAGSFCLPLPGCPSALLQSEWTGPASGRDLRWTYTFAGVIWGISTLIIRLAILSLPFVIWCVSGTLIYLGLKPDAAPKP